MEGYQVREYVIQLDIFKSLDPRGVNWWVQSDLADVIVKNDHDK